MNETLTVFKWFWSDQDQEQEAWLREMAQRGMHLQDVELLWRYTFASGPPSDTVYRMDASAANKPDYQQLMEDAGWRLVTKSDTWCYWCQSAAQGKPLEIFSDVESKTSQYNQVIIQYVVALSAVGAVINMLAHGKTMPLPVDIIIAVVFVACLTWTLYRILRLRRRIKQLQRD